MSQNSALQSQATQGGMGSDFRSGMNGIQFLCRCLSLPIEVCVRQFGTWGERFIGIEAVFGLLWPIAFAAFYGPYPGLNAVVLFWFGMIPLLVIHRLAGLSRRQKGYRCHSQYFGDSWFQLLPGFGKPSRAQTLEILVSIVLAIVVHEIVAKPLGTMLLISAFAHMVNLALVYQATAARLRSMHDAEIETLYYLNLHRNQHGF